MYVKMVFHAGENSTLHSVHGCNACITGSLARLSTHLADPMCLLGHCFGLRVPVLCSIPAAESAVQLLPPEHHLSLAETTVGRPHLLSKRFLSRQPEPPCRCTL